MSCTQTPARCQQQGPTSRRLPWDLLVRTSSLHSVGAQCVWSHIITYQSICMQNWARSLCSRLPRAQTSHDSEPTQDLSQGVALLLATPKTDAAGPLTPTCPPAGKAGLGNKSPNSPQNASRAGSGPTPAHHFPWKQTLLTDPRRFPEAPPHALGKKRLQTLSVF